MNLERRSETDDDAIVIEVEREYALSLAGFRNGLLHALNVGGLFNRMKKHSLRRGEWIPWFRAQNFKRRIGLDLRQAQKLMFLAEHRAAVIELNTKSTSYFGVEEAYSVLRDREKRPLPGVAADQLPLAFDGEPLPPPTPERLRYTERERLFPAIVKRALRGVPRLLQTRVEGVLLVEQERFCLGEPENIIERLLRDDGRRAA